MISVDVPASDRITHTPRYRPRLPLQSTPPPVYYIILSVSVEWMIG